jgi:hypothetical protein
MIPAGQGVIGFDRYVYSNNNPIRFVDPDGHFSIPRPLICPVGCSLINMSGWSGVTRFITIAFLALTVDNITGGRTGVYGDGNWGVIPDDECINSGAWSVPPVFGGIVGGADDLARGVGNLADDVVDDLGQTITKSIDTPQYRGGLKDAMMKSGNLAPSDMLNPQVHHDLPWAYRDWFAERGLNVNDPQFGRWVSGSPQGPHQNWTRAYNDAWKAFMESSPNATRKDVLSYLRHLRERGRYPSQ